MSQPPIPPRPAGRPEKSSNALLGSDLPIIPARPAKRIERSQSPDRFARSPLNEPLRGSGSKAQSIYSSSDANASSNSLVLPSLGQEGNEYAETLSVDQISVANDLKLHAPKPSLPVDSAKQRIQTVTRTDSAHAATFGIGHAQDPNSREASSTPSIRRDSSTLERPQSSAGEEIGIPVHGRRVPMYPNAGDVQAPSPAPGQTQQDLGAGSHHDVPVSRNHNRRVSGKGFEAPPGSYGLHGHGSAPVDRFEKAYYEKHPDMLRKETPHYQEERSGSAMSSADLNKIVRETASRGVGMGMTGTHIGGPTEQIGFMASEEYASRHATPRPPKSQSGTHHTDSPLKRDSVAEDSAEHSRLVGEALAADKAAHSEVEDDDVVHVDAPAHRINKIYGGAGHIQSTEDLGPSAENGGYRDEHGYSAPILASDEVAKEPFGYELQPAVSPMAERNPYEGGHDLGLYRTRSGQSSRPMSSHGVSNVKQTDLEGRSTPLEDLEEYEPLFPEDDAKTAKPTTAADKLKKRPEFHGHRFPSQDVWEDTPDSLKYTTTVETDQQKEADYQEDIPNVQRGLKKLQIKDGETAAQAFARQQEEIAERESRNASSFLQATIVPVNPTKNEHSRQASKPHPWDKTPAIASETRPKNKQRFPSRDVWEDTADSLMLQTTVSGPQTPAEIFSPAEERPTTGANVFHQEKAAAGIALADGEGRATTGLAATLNKPTIPARPVKSSGLGGDSSPVDSRGKPEIPTSTKPVIPARPVKSVGSSESTDGPSLSKEPSGGNESSAMGKSKPPVPSRPVGSKIAALQGGFMADLNKRLGLGPQQPKKEEPEEQEEVDKAPLEDARKGRARGPQRRAPAKTTATEASTSANQAFSFSTPLTNWAIHPEGTLYVSEPPILPDPKSIGTEATSQNTVKHDTETKSALPTLATNTAGEPLHAPIETSKTAEPVSSNHKQDARAVAEAEAKKENILASADNQSSTPTKLSDDPMVAKHHDNATTKSSEPSTDIFKDGVSGGRSATETGSEGKETKPADSVEDVTTEMPGAFDQ